MNIRAFQKETDKLPTQIAERKLFDAIGTICGTKDRPADQETHHSSGTRRYFTVSQYAV